MSVCQIYSKIITYYILTVLIRRSDSLINSANLFAIMLLEFSTNPFINICAINDNAENIIMHATV